MSHIELSDDRLCKEIAGEIRANVNGKVMKNEPLAAHTSFRVGGPAAFYVYPASQQDLSNLTRYCRDKGLEQFVIGYGTNLLVSDDGFAGCVIDLAEACHSVDIKGQSLYAGAGVWGNDVVKETAENGLEGLQKLAGIPGGLGGWIKMNSGAFRSSISDHLVSVRIMEPDGVVRELPESEVGFLYRSSPGLDEKVILGANFEFEKGNATELLKSVEDTITERRRRNVMTLPSAGSVFKNPEGLFAAKLIESVKAKGMRVGGVEVSNMHSNFIINKRGGTASDIVELIDQVRARVQKHHNVHLELELKTLGFK